MIASTEEAVEIRLRYRVWLSRWVALRMLVQLQRERRARFEAAFHVVARWPRDGGGVVTLRRKGGE